MTGLQMRNERSADATVDRLNLAAPSGYIQKHKCHAWFSGNLKAYIKMKKIFFVDVTRFLRLFPQQIFH
jgi:hypothetical protein